MNCLCYIGNRIILDMAEDADPDDPNPDYEEYHHNKVGNVWQLQLKICQNETWNPIGWLNIGIYLVFCNHYYTSLNCFSDLHMKW